jgi:hypothetical protein
MTCQRVPTVQFMSGYCSATLRREREYAQCLLVCTATNKTQGCSTALYCVLRCHCVNAYVSAPRTSIMHKSFPAGHQYQWRAENELSYSLHAAVVKENVDATVLRDCLRFNDTTACSFPVGTS